MTLPTLPYLTGIPEEDITRIYSYLQYFQESFANSAGFAIDPTLGEGGDGSLSIDTIPSITVVTSSALSVDGVLFGNIDVSFTKPSRAVAVVVGYKESTDTNYSYITSIDSPVGIPSLKVGTTYDIIVAGQAANGARGSFSAPIQVTLPVDEIVNSPIYVLSNITPNKLLGRGSLSGVGPVEEINLGNNIALSGTTLDVTISSVGQEIKKTSDQGFMADGNISEMLFNVEAGKYYNIRFVVLASADIGQSGVGLDITYPTAEKIAFKVF